MPNDNQAQPFTGTLTFLPSQSKGLGEGHAPGGRTIRQNQATGSWSGLQFGGHAATCSTFFGVGIADSPSSWKAQGYDVGTLANGDQFQGEWEEVSSGGISTNVH